MSMMRDLRAVVRPALRKGDAYAAGSGAAPRAGADALGDSVVDCAVYTGGRRCAERLTPREALERVRGAGEGFVWIGLHEPGERELAGLAGEFGLHPLAVEDAVHAHQRPKLERYDDTLFTVFKTIRYVEHAELTATSEVVETGEVMVFTGPDFVITVRHGGHGSLRALRHRLEDEPELLVKGPSAVLHAISDRVVDDYLAVCDAVQSDIDEVEIDVFSDTATSGADTTAGRIYQLKREVLEFKRAVTPLMRPLQLLSERPLPVVDPGIQKYFRDVADHLVRVHEQVVGFDDLLNSILQANLAQATVAQNEDMRKITAWAAILAVPTMITGVYGMNFDHMPELHTRYGYYVVLVSMVVVCAAIHRGFRRNGWL
ncbi:MULTISPECIES: magnesium and cobalt transport protein CorA [Streptomycetaceae]|uniref:Putative metal-transport protein n=1 Tax=Streptantibioticus cattleyicolor (strain ATCC 35852 / DSM 46488 / JCM 4925 / NBRC 14057 / NRRL 8057) TaxID=1003195 RepID=F8K529_STREN|nr:MULTISPECIES: magnesium and cobalt transport protein CorA [Streptomycetaceae]AEW96371.1 putative metal-transport protein [Streptantibioticus cattleyicolor NRRL 8057 = DSM 46488]MYS60885.1 magnesium transporter CorA [Streptomyces sp. SID5468]CCB76711.1 Metal-transport protein [Streptantibioticus cattleyicolor NRRL 8057 = DSM 46488]